MLKLFFFVLVNKINQLFFFDRERALLWDKNHSSNTYKQNIAMTVAHELTHMWFGDLITCQWWSYTWLNEGFARYFQYMIPTEVCTGIL